MKKLFINQQQIKLLPGSSLPFLGRFGFTRGNGFNNGWWNCLNWGGINSFFNYIFIFLLFLLLFLLLLFLSFYALLISLLLFGYLILFFIGLLLYGYHQLKLLVKLVPWYGIRAEGGFWYDVAHMCGECWKYFTCETRSHIDRIVGCWLLFILRVLIFLIPYGFGKQWI